MIYRLIAFIASMAGVFSDAHALRTQMTRRYGWMPE